MIGKCFLKSLNTLKNSFIVGKFEVKNAQKDNFPQIAIITKGTFLTFLTDNPVCFYD